VATPYTFDPRTNDTDQDSDPLTVATASPPLHGMATVDQGGGSITYRGLDGYTGYDEVLYTVVDPSGGQSGAGKVKINVGNITPSANNDEYSITGQVGDPVPPVDLYVMDNDFGNGIHIMSVSALTNGTGTLAIGGGGTFVTYDKSGVASNGTDSFTYTISDGTTNRSASVTLELVAEGGD
jgi:hypothetical protein